MLECETVCSRVSIMKRGEIICLGNNQHIRSTHGTGFQLELHLQAPLSFAAATTEAYEDGNEENSAMVIIVERVKSFVATHFLDAQLLEEHSTMLNYEIPRQSIAKLSQAFKLLESNKESLMIKDYNLSQSTLEQVRCVMCVVLTNGFFL